MTRASLLVHRPIGRRRWAAAAALVVLCACSAAAAPAPPSARVLYDRAVTLDHNVRAAMKGPRASAPGPDNFRAAIAAYERVVWHHPTSGYCDNALWQASQLAVEAFDRFGQDRDRLAAVASLRRLAKEYPTSGYVRRARAGIQRLDSMATAANRNPAPPNGRPRPAERPATPPAAPATPAVVNVDRVTRRAAADQTTLVIDLSGPVTFRDERLASPPRIFFDLTRTQPSETLKDAILTFATGLVRQVRVGRHPNAVTRIVMDAEGVGRYKAELLSSPHRLVVTFWPDAIDASPVIDPAQRLDLPPGPVPPVVASQPPASQAPEATAPRTAAPVAVIVAPPTPPAATEERPVPIVQAPAESTPPAGGDQPASDMAAPATPASNAAGGYSLARQLGLGASRIVIDAGHGGHDPGAMVGARTEASITLDIALRLEKLLLKQPGVDVILTRRTDVFIPLQERTAIANREGADLFVSIHVNASENTNARGIETYLLDFASNADAERVAARENASSQMTMNDLNDLVKRIALTTKADESRDLASVVQRSLVRKLRSHNPSLRDLGVKRAPFVVLIGASMPSVLVEVAFLTHRQERRLLATSGYRQQLAESIADGIRRYQQGLKKASPVVLRRAAPQQPGAPEALPTPDRIQ